MKLLLRGIEYNVTVNNPIKDVKSEELDSATASIVHLDHKITIHSLDRVILFDDNFTYYLCVDTYTRTKVNPKKNEEHYNYEIQLVSETKLLEGIICPNLNITKTDNNHTIYHYLIQYLNEYGKKDRNGLVWSFSFETNIMNKLLKTCPEMTWNRPTLREVFTDLMMLVDCIPVLRNNFIYAYDLTERHVVEGGIKGINYEDCSESLDNYASDIEMELQNVIQDKEDGVYNYTNLVEYMGFRSDSGYALNTNNVVIRTKSPIYKINHLWICISTKKIEGLVIKGYRLFEIDLCNIKDNPTGSTYNLVREIKEVNTLPILFTSGSVNTFREMSECQNFVLSYERGGNEIIGFYDTTKRFWNMNTDWLTTFMSILSNTINDGTTDFASNNTLKDIGFKIEYQALAETKFRAGKYLRVDNQRTIIDNQTNSYVNANKQGLLEYMKVNRLGNELLKLNARVTRKEDVAELGTLYDEDNVVFQREIKVNPNYIDVNYYATKHYILRDYYTGIKSKIRSWKIDDEEVLVRKDVEKYYYEFSFSHKEENVTVGDITPYTMLSSFMTHFEDEILKAALLKTHIGVSDIELPEPSTGYKYFLNELDSKVMGNSIVFSTKLEDNYSVGKRVDSNESISIGGTSYDGTEADVSYVDEYGEINYATMIVASNLNQGNDSFDFPELLESVYGFKYSALDPIINPQLSSNLTNLFNNKPLAKEDILEDAIYYTYTFNYHKDQREIPMYSIQLEYCSESKDIVIGNQFIRDNNLISTHLREKWILSQYTITADLYSLVVYNTNDKPTAPLDSYIICTDDNYYRRGTVAEQYEDMLWEAIPNTTDNTCYWDYSATYGTKRLPSSGSGVGYVIAVKQRFFNQGSLSSDQLYSSYSRYFDYTKRYSYKVYGGSELPSNNSGTNGQIIAVKTRNNPSSASLDILLNLNTYTWNNETRQWENGTPSLSNGEVVDCNYKELNTPSNYITIYTDTVLNWSDHSNWNNYFSVQTSNQIFVSGYDNAGTEYAKTQGGQISKLKFHFVISSGARLKVYIGKSWLSIINGTADSSYEYNAGTIDVEFLGTEVSAGIGFELYNLNGSYQTISITRSVPGHDEYEDASITLTTYSVGQRDICVNYTGYNQDKWKTLFYPATLKHYLYYWNGSQWVRSTNIENYQNLYAKIRATNYWREWSISNHIWINYTIGYITTKKLCVYNNGYIFNDHTSSNYYCQNEDKYYRWATINGQERWYQVTSDGVNTTWTYDWRFYKKVSGVWQDDSDDNTSYWYYCPNENKIYKWNGSDTWIQVQENDFSYLFKRYYNSNPSVGFVESGDLVLNGYYLHYEQGNPHYYIWNGSNFLDATRLDWISQGSADGLYFTFEGVIYRYIAIDNQLVTISKGDPDRNQLREDLSLFWSDEAVKVYDMNYTPVGLFDLDSNNNYIYKCPGNPIDSINKDIDNETKSANIVFNLGVVGKRAYYLCDENHNVLLAFNNPYYESDEDEVTIYLNQLKFRNI